MSKLARIAEGVIAELPVPVDGFALADCFHPDFIAALVEVPDDAEIGWVLVDDAWAAPAEPEVDLAALKAALKSSVDAAAEIERAKYITPGSGQAMTYQQKASEAVMLEDDPDPDPADYPLLSAEVGITAPTLAEVGAVVRQAHDMWILLGAGIEAARLSAKKAIDAAPDTEGAQAAAAVEWPSPTA